MEIKWRLDAAVAAQKSQEDFWAFFDQQGIGLESQLVRGQWDLALHILRDPVPRYLKDTVGKTALEIGYGGGRLLAAACRYFKFVYGVDVHENSDLVGAMLREKGVNNSQLLTTDGRSEIPLQASSVDFVYSFIVFVHLEDHQVFELYLSEIFRLLRPGGVAQIYFGRPFGERTRSLPHKWLRNLAFGLEWVPEVLVYDLLRSGYREVGETERTALRVTYKKAKQVAKSNGLKVVGTGSSYYRVPDQFPHIGSQRFICLLKPRS